MLKSSILAVCLAAVAGRALPFEEKPSRLGQFAQSASAQSASAQGASAESAEAQSPRAEAPPRWSASDLSKLSWIAGVWQIKDGETTTEEHWLPLAGSTLMGLSHTYDLRTTKFFEYLRITARDNAIEYVAQPGGGKAVSFPAVAISDREAVFENEKHDHPQRIRYERTADGLTATISLLDGTKASTFAFKKR